MPGIVLIAEDDDLTRAMLRHALEERDYQVFETRNGQECLQQYQQIQPNLILLDGIMPVMDGYACCAALRKYPEAAQTPIVMISGQKEDASIERAFASGVTDYMLKPIQWSIFFRRISQLIKQSLVLEHLAHQNAEFQQSVMVDDLTQVLNRRAFDQSLEKEWRRVLRETQSLSIILAEVDGLKVYRDTHGNIAADLHLQQIAQVISRAVYRSSDLVCRYSGEAFGILLPNTPDGGAIYVAIRIQAALKDVFQDRNSVATHKPTMLSYVLSSQIPSQQIEPTEFLEVAETALRQAKRTGRNPIAVHLFKGGVEPQLNTEWLQPNSRAL
jgi:diguanylate cyclase (GGDEF)-like protein